MAFIQKYINKRRNLLINCDFNTQNIQKAKLNVQKNKIFIKVPYKYGLYNKIKKVMDKNKYQVIPSINKDLNKFIKKGKIDFKHNKTVVVYKIKCKDCPQIYIGKTKRSLYMRISEHQNTENHNFDFKNIYIVDQESKWVKRTVSESINIHLHEPTINLKEDTNNVNVSYIHTINTLKRRWQYTI